MFGRLSPKAVSRSACHRTPKPGGFLREPVESRISETIHRRQEEHHRKIGFQDELRALLRKHEIEWDEKYVWD
jgi:hypothetical protein